MFKYKKDGLLGGVKGIMSVPTDFGEPAIKPEKEEVETESEVETETESTTQSVPAAKVPQDDIANRKNEAEREYLKWKEREAPKYSSEYKSSIEKLIAELAGREFTYDVTKDEVYRRYRDSVKSSAELALADAVGLSSALNGGYSTTYAQLAGQSAYYNVMKEADSIIPQLYRDAYERFSNETDNIEDRLDYLIEMDESEWDRYLSMLDEYNSEGDRLYERFRDLSDEEFDRFYSVYKLSF